MFNLSAAGAMHTILASLAIGIGIIQFWRRKGDRVHRALGYLYVYGLLVADGAAMLIYQFTGKLNILHFGAVTNLICIALGMFAVLARPPNTDWRSMHYNWISWSYVGLLAAAATELIVRTVAFSNQMQIWSATAAATITVTAVGFVLIKRNRPMPLA
jgi:uncharacterized membrane protein